MDVSDSETKIFDPNDNTMSTLAETPFDALSDLSGIPPELLLKELGAFVPQVHSDQDASLLGPDQIIQGMGIEELREVLLKYLEALAPDPDEPVETVETVHG